MKKLIVVLMIMAITLLALSLFALSQPQDSAKEEKPTFYRLTPGVYVNGYPRFTITYPKDWVERTPLPGGSFLAGTPGSTRGAYFAVNCFPSPLPLEKFADFATQWHKNVARDVTLVSDKPSQLRDGTVVQEVEHQMVRNNEPFNWLIIAMKKGDLLINTGVGGPNVKIGEDLKGILYSLEFQPDKDELVKVPPDIQEFLDNYCNDIVSHDVVKVMTYYSDMYLNSGTRKGEVEWIFRQSIGHITSCEVGIIELVPAGDKVYLTGFANHNTGKWPLPFTSIIKENGEWKWYGNQRDVSP